MAGRAQIDQCRHLPSRRPDQGWVYWNESRKWMDGKKKEPVPPLDDDDDAGHGPIQLLKNHSGDTEDSS